MESADGAVHVLSSAYDKDNRRIRVSDNTGASVRYPDNCKNQCIREERKLSDTQIQKTDCNGITTQYTFNMYGAPLYHRVKDKIEWNQNTKY